MAQVFGGGGGQAGDEEYEDDDYDEYGGMAIELTEEDERAVDEVTYIYFNSPILASCSWL